MPGFTAAARVIAEAGAAPAVVIAGYLLLLALIVFRRFRQLLVLVVSYEVLTLLTTAFLLAVHRPLPFGVLVQFRWAGFSMPSVEIEKVCAVLVGALYTLVPAGRWPQPRRMGRGRDRRAGRRWPGCTSASTRRPTCWSAPSSA